MNWKLIVLVVGILILSFLLFKQCKTNNDLKYKLSVQDSLVQLDSARYFKLFEEYESEKQAKHDLENRNKELFEIINKNNETIRYYSELVVKLKNQKYSRVDTTVKFVMKDSIIYVPYGDDVVYFDEENDIMRIHGKTFLYPQKGYLLNVDGKPVNVEVVVTEKKGMLTGYIDTGTPDLELTDATFRFLREPKSFWSDVDLIGSINATTKNTFIDLGVTKGNFGVKGIVGYDFQNYRLNKNDIFYGFGIILKTK